MNIALFIATKKGYYCLESLVESGVAGNISFVTSFEETNVEKSYDTDIKSLCEKYGIRYYAWKDLKNSLFEIIKESDIAISFAIGWKFLIDTMINNMTKYGLIIFHDSLLPKYKGFAPTPTAIICGEKIIGVTAISASDGIDDGDIILQKEMEVSDGEYIGEIIDRQCKIYSDMIKEIVELAENDELVYEPQDETRATYSIRRNPEDCHIDWSCEAKAIYNLIRAVSSPFPGAYTIYKGKKIIVKRASLAKEMKFAIRDCGKLWSTNQNMATVICGRGMLCIEEASYEDGGTVIFDKLRERLK